MPGVLRRGVREHDTEQSRGFCIIGGIMNRMFILSIEVDDSWHDLTDEEVREMLKENEEGQGIKVTNISRTDLQGRVWPCWNLSVGDITLIAAEKGLSLEGKDFEEIAHRTKKGIENSLGEWPWDIIVEEAIKNTESVEG